MSFFPYLPISSFPAEPRQRRIGDSLVDEMLLMTSRATAVDASISIDSGLVVLVPKELSHGLESSWLGVKQNFRA
jgi:hypothetical protein